MDKATHPALKKISDEGVIGQQIDIFDVIQQIVRVMRVQRCYRTQGSAFYTSGHTGNSPR